MYDYDIKDKPVKKKRLFPYFSVGLIVVGFAILIGGAVYYENTDMEAYYKDSLSEVSEQIDGSKITSVNIDFSAGEIYVGRSEDGQVHLEGSVPKSYVLKETNGELKVALVPAAKDRIFGINYAPTFNWDSIDAVLYLPDKEYEEFKFDAGAGEVTIEGINCGKAKIDVGAGQVTLNGIECSGVMKVDTGAGEINVSGSKTGGLKLDVGAGQINYAGEVNGDIDADCGVGQCNIDLTNSKEDYNKKYTIKTDVGLGDVKVSYGN